VGCTVLFGTVVWFHLLLQWRIHLQPPLVAAWQELQRLYRCRSQALLDMRVEELVAERRLNRYCTILNIFFVPLWPLVCILMVALVVKFVVMSRTDDIDDVLDVLSRAIDDNVFSILPTAWGFTISFWRRSAWKANYVRFINIVLALHFAYSGPSVQLFVVRTSFALLTFDARFVIICHGLSLPMYGAVQIALGRDGWADVFPLALSLFAFTSLCALVLEMNMRAGVLADVETRSSKTFSLAAETLLQGMCDAVVRLDDDLNITTPAPKLGGLLLSTANTEGASFLKFIYDEEECESFLQFMDRDCDMIASTKYMVLRDSNEMRVNVQVFHTVCELPELMGGCAHILGIRDMFEEERMLHQQQHAQAHSRRTSGISVASSDVCTELESVDDLCSNAGSFVFDIGAASIDATVWVELETTRFQMISCTPAFANIVGPALAQKGRSFLELLTRADQLRVGKALRGHISQYWNGEDRALELFFMIHSLHGRRNIVASFNLDLSKTDALGEMGVLTFTAMRKPRTKPVHARRWDAAGTWLGADILLNL